MGREKKQVSAHRSHEETPKHRRKENNHNSTDSYKKAHVPLLNEAPLFPTSSGSHSLLLTLGSGFCTSGSGLLALGYRFWVLEFRLSALVLCYGLLFDSGLQGLCSLLWALVCGSFHWAPGSRLWALGSLYWALGSRLKVLDPGLWTLFT